MSITKKISCAVIVGVTAVCLTACSGDGMSTDPYSTSVELKDGRTVQCVAVMDNGIDCDFDNATKN